MNFGKQKTTPKGTAPQPTRRKTKAKRAATFKLSKKARERAGELHFSLPRYFVMDDSGALLELPGPPDMRVPEYEVVEVDREAGTITLARLPGV